MKRLTVIVDAQCWPAVEAEMNTLALDKEVYSSTTLVYKGLQDPVSPWLQEAGADIICFSDDFFWNRLESSLYGKNGLV